MRKIIDIYCGIFEFLIALMLALMVILVFGNVVLRYGFNSGIAISEEVARWLFIWITAACRTAGSTQTARSSSTAPRP